MQHFAIYLFLWDALHVSDGFSAHRQELKTARTASDIGLTTTWCCTCSFELLTMDGKNRLKHVQRLTEINKLWNVASCWLYSANFDITLAISATYILVLVRGMVFVLGHATMTLDDWWSMFWDSMAASTLRFIKLHTTSLNKDYPVTRSHISEQQTPPTAPLCKPETYQALGMINK